MVHTTPPHRVAEAIMRDLDASGISVRQAAEQTAIARTTLTRNLSTGNFTVAQLAALADLLGCTVADFFTQDAA